MNYIIELYFAIKINSNVAYDVCLCLCQHRFFKGNIDMYKKALA